MSSSTLKRQKCSEAAMEESSDESNCTLVTANPVFLNEHSLSLVETHCDSVYTGSRIRIWHPITNNQEGRLAYVHWGCDKGVFVLFEDTERNEMIPMHTGCRFVVDQRSVKVGALQVMKRHGTDEISDDKKKLSLRFWKTKFEKVLKNDIIFRFPTSIQQQSYECYKFKVTCFCELKIRPKLFFCSVMNKSNPRRPYYGCRNRLSKKTHCNFFVWESDFDHGIDKQCQCGRHCKKIDYPTDSGKFYLVCFYRNNGGCRMFEKVH